MDYDIIGMIAVSLAGRDKHRAFAVVGRLDDEHLLIADGRLRRAEKPKKKKLRHLSVTADRIDLSRVNRDCMDAYIRRSLAALGYGVDKTKEG